VVTGTGRLVRLDAVSNDYSPRRVVSLQPSATVILKTIGKLDRLVACTKYCADVCPEVKSRNVGMVADSWTSKTFEIVASEPDLVIASVPYQEKAVAEILKSGARFLGLAPKNLADIYADIAAIAGVMGVTRRGEQVTARMKKEIAAVRRKTRGKERPRVFCEEWGKPVIASQPWVADLVEAAGGIFVGTPGKTILPEAVLAENPDIVVAAWCGAGDRVPLEKIVNNRDWSEMRAVNNGQVFCIRDEFLNTPAPTLLHGLRALAAAIHPQDFPQAPGLRCITEVRQRNGSRLG
jgi:iron complex transport system substrate-binding protein